MNNCIHRNIKLEEEAMQFFKELHKHQKRKYTNEGYFVHLQETVDILRTVPHTSEMVAALYGHDSIEDQNLTREILAYKFGHVVAGYIDDLSDKATEGIRSQRKEFERLRLGTCCQEVQTMKVCDILSNTKDIVQHDPKFAVIYLSEKRLLLGELRLASPVLLQRAYKQIPCVASSACFNDL